MEKPCEVCGQTFHFKPSRASRARFCSKRCLGISNAERLQRQREEYAARTGSRTFGVEPWAKNHAKGKHLSPDSEFRPGHTPANKLPVGYVTIRRDKAGARRAWVKVAEPNSWKLRAVVVWGSTHGQLRPDLVVHHVDRNPLNDNLSNLRALTRTEHLLEHQEEYLKIRRLRSAAGQKG